MSNNWLFNIRHIAAGEPVQAEIVGRPDKALEQRTDYLKDRLDAAALGRALFDVDATIAPDVLEGQPVFWNYQTQRYERALAAVENDDITQTLVVQASSDCLGLLYSKKSPTLGDIVLRGIVKLPGLTNAITGPITAGRYYLSSEAPGKLVKQRPPATVSVCYVQGAKDSCAAEPWVVVMPQVRDFLEDHIHYRFELVTRAAGVLAVANGKVSITQPDGTLQGWLPASHAVFNGKAPAGAVFGYNLSAHLQLSRVWPPQPVSAVAMLWDKGQNLVGATEIPLGREGLAICDANGIWWTSDCVGDVPWVAGVSSSSSSSSSSLSSSSSTSAVPECPRDERMRVIVVFLRMVFGNDRSVVTSLQAGPGSPIRVTNCDGLVAKTGDLELNLDLNLAIKPPDLDGARVLKSIEDGYKFRQGWVTEGVVSGSAPIVVTGYPNNPAAARALTAAEKTGLGFPAEADITAYRGLVKIAFNDALVERELSPQIIRLSDAVERLYKDVPYIGFPSGQDSLVRLRFIVPAAGLGSGLQVVLRTQLLGLSIGTLPALEVTYRRLPRPTGGVAVTLAAVDVTPALTFPSSITLTAANSVVEVSSAPIPVEEGDTLLVTIRRGLVGTGPDGYTGEVGLLRLSGIVTNVEL
jgi:hypothetical protein